MRRRCEAIAVMQIVLFGAVLAFACTACAGSDAMTVSGTGTVQRVEIEGGFYGIVADDGAKYDPSNLAAEFQHDGLRVKFTVRIREGVMTIRMWGTPVEVLSIGRL